MKKGKIVYQYKATKRTYEISQDDCLLEFRQDNKYVGMLCMSDLPNVKKWKEYYYQNHK